MPQRQFTIGMKHRPADAGEGVLELHFLDAIENKEVFDWDSMQVKERSLLQEVIDRVNACQPDRIRLHIDSWGGDADLGKGIYNFLKAHSARKEARIVNKAASAATVIACAGHVISMPATGMYVIHKASSSATGTADDLRRAADVADLYTDAYCDIYACENRKGLTSSDIKALIADGDYWMTGTQACEMGFVDECFNDEAVSVQANIAAARAQYAGGDVPPSLSRMERELGRPAGGFTNDFNQLFMNLKESVAAFFSGRKVTAPVKDGAADVTAAVEPLVAGLAAAFEQAVKADFEAVQARLAADAEARYGSKIEALEAKNAELARTVDDLTADLTALAGAESRPGARGAKEQGGRRARSFGDWV